MVLFGRSGNDGWAPYCGHTSATHLYPETLLWPRRETEIETRAPRACTQGTALRTDAVWADLRAPTHPQCRAALPARALRGTSYLYPCYRLSPDLSGTDFDRPSSSSFFRGVFSSPSIFRRGVIEVSDAWTTIAIVCVVSRTGNYDASRHGDQGVYFPESGKYGGECARELAASPW